MPALKRYQPLVLQKLDIRLPDVHVRQLALHQHLAETTAVQPHAHRFAQCLLYLSGQGRQLIAGRAHPIQAGAVVFLPPHVEHAFHRETGRHPICLVIDFDWRGMRHRPARVAPMPLALLREVRQQLAGLAQEQRTASPAGPPLQQSALILKLLNLLLAGTAMTPPPAAGFSSPVLRKVETLLATPGSADLPLAELAQLAGYQRDHLNRLVKSSAGLTLGQLRARKRATRAQQLLQQAGPVAAVAEAAGFSDPNYFSRWFRKQTGLSPGRWRRMSRAAPKAGISPKP